MRRLGALTTATIALTLISGPAAHATTTDPAVEPGSAQAAAIAAWEAGGATVAVDDERSNPATAASGGSRTMSLYRGSWVLWARESVQFGYAGDGRTVTWSSAWQDSGWVVPNNVKEGGTTRFVTTSTLHSWRGKYTIGVGVPTPWGTINVYSSTAYARSDVRNIGSKQWWLD